MNNALAKEEFRLALRNGLGRVLQCLKTNPPDAYLNLIEHGCTHELGYDPQCEGSRDDWMAEIAELAGGLSRFRDAILSALASTTDYYDARLMFGLAGRLAAAGDDEAHRVMYAAFENGLKRTNDWTGAAAIVKLDGKEGLRFVAQVYGRKCKVDPEFWQGDMRWYTDDHFQEGDVEKSVREMSKDDADIRAYLDRFTESDESSGNKLRSPTKVELEEMTFGEVFASEVGRIQLRRWARVAADEELEAAAEQAEREDDPEELRRILTCFTVRPYPSDPSLLIDLLDSPDEMMRNRAQRSLELVEAPSVRDKALELLGSPGKLDVAISLLCSNYVPDDADRVLAELPISTLDVDEEYIHAICGDLLDLFNEERAADATEAFGWIYEHSPCSICRERALKILDELDAVPDWMRDECQYDCDQGIRQMFSGID